LIGQMIQYLLKATGEPRGNGQNTQTRGANVVEDEFRKPRQLVQGRW